VVQSFQHLQSGSHSKRISRQSSGLINRTKRSKTIHNFVSSRKSAYRKTTTNYFTETNNICIDAKQFLRSTFCQTETGHYFVKNQYGSVLITNLAKPFQETFLMRNATHISCYGFDDNSSDFTFIFVK